MFITENEEQKRKNDAIRIQIIDSLMNIYNTKSLERIKMVTGFYRNEEQDDHAMSINEIAKHFDQKDAEKILDIVEHMENYEDILAYQQMHTAFSKVV